MKSAYAWLGSFVAAALPTGAIIAQMTQQAESLRQQLRQLEQQNLLAEQQLSAAEQDRADALAARLDHMLSENFAVMHQGSTSEQHSLARLLVSRFGDDACGVLADWADSSTSVAQWEAVASAAPGCAISPPEGCGRVYLLHLDPRDADKLYPLAEALRAAGCQVSPPIVHAGRASGIYASAAQDSPAAGAVREHLRRILPARERSHIGHTEIVFSDL